MKTFHIPPLAVLFLAFIVMVIHLLAFATPDYRILLVFYGIIAIYAIISTVRSALRGPYAGGTNSHCLLSPREAVGRTTRSNQKV